MTTPIRVHVDNLRALDRSLSDYFLMLGEERLRNCVDFNEAEGWADVWEADEQGRVVGEPRLKRVHGVVRLYAPPELRAWFEERFAVEGVDGNERPQDTSAQQEHPTN